MAKRRRSKRSVRASRSGKRRSKRRGKAKTIRIVVDSTRGGNIGRISRRVVF